MATTADPAALGTPRACYRCGAVFQPKTLSRRVVVTIFAFAVAWSVAFAWATSAYIPVSEPPTPEQWVRIAASVPQVLWFPMWILLPTRFNGQRYFCTNCLKRWWTLWRSPGSKVMWFVAIVGIIANIVAMPTVHLANNLSLWWVPSRGPMKQFWSRQMPLYDAEFDGRNLGQHADASAVAFSPDGGRVAIAHGLTLKVWDANSGYCVAQANWADEREARTDPRPAIRGLAYSPDGQRLAALRTDGRLRILGSDGSLLRSLDEPTCGEPCPQNARSAHDYSRTIQFSVDGTMLFAARWWTLVAWNVADGTVAFSHPTYGPVGALTPSPDGTTLIGTASMDADGAILRWKLPAGEPMPPLARVGKTVLDLAYDKNGGRIVAVAARFGRGGDNSPRPNAYAPEAVQIDASTGAAMSNALFRLPMRRHERVWGVDTTERPSRVGLRSDGSFSVTYGGWGLVVDMDRGAMRIATDYGLYVSAPVAFGPDATRFVVGTWPPRIWDVRP